MALSKQTVLWSSPEPSLQYSYVNASCARLKLSFRTAHNKIDLSLREAIVCNNIIINIALTRLKTPYFLKVELSDFSCSNTNTHTHTHTHTLGGGARFAGSCAVLRPGQLASHAWDDCGLPSGLPWIFSAGLSTYRSLH